MLSKDSKEYKFRKKCSYFLTQVGKSSGKKGVNIMKRIMSEICKERTSLSWSNWDKGWDRSFRPWDKSWR